MFDVVNGFFAATFSNLPLWTVCLILLQHGSDEGVDGTCRVLSAADMGCCALEIGKCQPQYRIQQHKLTQQHLIRSPTRLNYCTHAVKTKRGNYNVQDQKRG